MKYLKNAITIIGSLAMLSSHYATAQTCNAVLEKTTPDSRFIDLSDGTVKDTHTGLVWMRCAIGSSWSGSECTGSGMTFFWDDALKLASDYDYADSSDWRVPNIKELNSIVELSCGSPAINMTIFPDAAGAEFWTSSPASANDERIWNINFSSGYPNYASDKDSQLYVRLVRFDDN